MKRLHLALYGSTFIIAGLGSYLFGVLIAVPRRLFLSEIISLEFNESILWYSGIPLVLGLVLMLADLLVLYPAKRTNELIPFTPLREKTITAALTAYNDELSIGESVKDFLEHPLVKRVIVVSNNSSDRTYEIAENSGALTFNEQHQGYGACVLRALTEASKFNDTEIVILCEGDMTFRAYDIEKLISYIPHCDIVNGTRTVEQLRDKSTQLSTFMFYGNLFVAKLLEIKHLGNLTLTDVGTTYKALRVDTARKLIEKLSPSINLEFNPYLIDTAVSNNFRVIECPITFHKRLGESKGGNVNNFIALKLGLKMISGIIFGWKKN